MPRSETTQETAPARRWPGFRPAPTPPPPADTLCSPPRAQKIRPPFSHARRRHKQRARRRAKHAQARERREQHRHRPNQLAWYGLKKRFRAAQRPDRRRQSSRPVGIRAPQLQGAAGSVPAPPRQRLAMPLPAPVHSSHVASKIPSEISLPLKTWISSRISTICPTTALKPRSASAARAPNADTSSRGRAPTSDLLVSLVRN